VQNGTEEALGHGTIYQKRKDISPGICPYVKQVVMCNESSSSEASNGGAKKPSSPSSLSLINHHSNGDSISMSEPGTSNSLRASKENSSVEYIPAGANICINNKKLKDERDTKSTRLRREQKPAGVRDSSHPLPLNITNSSDTVLDFISSQSTSATFDRERNEVQSSVKKHTEHCDKIAKKKQQSLVSFFECLEMGANSINKNDSHRTENIGDVPCDITEKETSVATKSFFQVIANSVDNSTQAKKQKMFDDVKNNSVSPNSIPDVTAKRHDPALGSVLKQEASRGDTRVRSVNSLAR
jgi:transcription elongation factor Elf1